MAPSSWTDAADKALLLAMIARGGLNGSEWPNVATDMQLKGYQVSASACKQHFHKLRKENGIALGGGRSAAAPQAKKATPSKGKKRVADEDNDDDEEPRNDSPSAKRVKKDSLKKEESYEDEGFASQSASSFKIEDLDDEGKPSRRQVIDLENDDLYEDS